MHYTGSHASPSWLTMLAPAEDAAWGSTPSLFLQMYKIMAARRKAISPISPNMAGTFIVVCFSLLSSAFKVGYMLQMPRCWFLFLKAVMAEGCCQTPSIVDYCFSVVLFKLSCSYSQWFIWVLHVNRIITGLDRSIHLSSRLGNKIASNENVSYTDFSRVRTWDETYFPV